MPQRVTSNPSLQHVSLNDWTPGNQGSIWFYLHHWQTRCLKPPSTCCSAKFGTSFLRGQEILLLVLIWQPVPKMSLLRHPSPSSARLRASHAVPSVFNGAGTNLVVAQAFWPRAGIIPFDPYHEFCEETEVRCKL